MIKNMRFLVLFVLCFTFSLQALANRYNDLLQGERRIQELAQQYADEGYSVEQFYNNIIQKLDHNEALDPPAADYLNRWNLTHSRFHTQRLQLVLEKQEYFLRYVQASITVLAEREIQRLENSWSWWWNFFSWRKKSQIESCLRETKIYFNKWNVNKNTLVNENAKQEDRRNRLYAFREHFDAVFRLLRALGRSPQIQRSPSAPKWGVSKVLAGVVTRNYFPACFPQSPNCTPFTQHLNYFMRNWAEDKDIQMIVQGRENLTEDGIALNFGESGEKPSEVSGKVRINLFLPAHRSTTLDAMAMAGLDLPHYLLFANPVSVVGKRLSGFLANQPEFIGVGPSKGREGLDPLTKVSRALENRLSPNIINYPQGSVSNAGEILPIHTDFVKKLLYPLTQQYEVNIFPISYEIDSGFLLPQGRRSNSHEVKIHPPLHSPSVQKLVQIQLGEDHELGFEMPPRIIDNLLLSSWYEAIQRHGELSIKDLIERAEITLGLSFDPNWDENKI